MQLLVLKTKKARKWYAENCHIVSDNCVPLRVSNGDFIKVIESMYSYGLYFLADYSTQTIAEEKGDIKP